MATVTSPEPSLDDASSDKDPRPPAKDSARVAKKRTKTGCLTCRRRRIKCDEFQPMCQNCKKAKRLCQYKQFSFKDNMTMQRPQPLELQHGAQGMDFTFAQSGAFGQSSRLTGPAPESQAQHITNLPHPFAPLRPRPASGHYYDWITQDTQAAPVVSSYDPLLSYAGLNDTIPAFDADPAAADILSAGAYHSALMPSHNIFDLPFVSTPSGTSMPSAVTTSLAPHFGNLHPQGLPSAASTAPSPAFSSSRQPDDYRSTSHPFLGPHSALDTGYADMSSAMSLPESHLDHQSYCPIDHTDHRKSSTLTTVAPAQSGFMFLSRAFSEGLYDSRASRAQALQDASRRRHTPEQLRDISDALENAAVEEEDDEYYDVLTEDEDADYHATSFLDTQRSDVQAMQSLYHQSGLLRQRGIHAFIYPGFIDHYRAERVASPLKNEATARVFAHFVTATGPMLSAFERIPRVNPTLTSFSGMPTAHLSLWTFTLPMRALHNQGLLHAMLAMSSLHIARLQGASITPSYKHYSWSVKRVHKAVGRHEGRHEVAVLAATLLLAFYEVMTADLIKWIPHLCGARQLILEIDYVGMSQQIASLKAERAMFDQAQPFLEHPAEAFIDTYPEIDSALIDTLTASQWATDPTDQVATPPHPRCYSISELSTFEVFQDLYWWYVKQDMVHSVISGDPPLMHYSHWTRCPPRAPLGQRGAIYGSFDHVILLIGRVCDFTSRDIPRKVAASEANGSSWSPATFYGMAPSAAAAYVPRVYAQAAHPPIDLPQFSAQAQSGQRPKSTLQAQNERALAEWTSLEAAFATLERRLAVPGFMPLQEDELAHFNTPFGRVVQYDSFNLAVLHMFVQMGRLLLARAHPYMPPAMAMAVGAASAQTSACASLIGRIAAGVTPLLSESEALSPQLAGTFTDCTLPLFLAGVQYRDPAQRYWTVSRLHEIEERSGWASAGLCASGCETAWEKAGEFGVGPPYVRLRTDLGAV